MPRPLKEIIPEKDFLKIFQPQTNEILKICAYLNEKENRDFLYTKRFYGNITTQARLLEDFLDDYGAKNNRTWIYFRELIASARYMGFSAYMIQHIRKRYAVYSTKTAGEEEFFDQTVKYQHFFNGAIKAVFRCISDEAVHLGLTAPREKLKEDDYLDVASNKMLPNNVDEDFSSREEENVVKIASDYLNIMRDHADFKIDHTYTTDQIESLIPEYISEEKLRRFELRIHNLQSLYDTYIKNTKIEAENNTLTSMRGYISLALHLAEIATTLSHFYERHESELRHESSQHKLERIIDKSQILECIVNYCLLYCYRCLEQGSHLAKIFLKNYTVIDSVTVRIPSYMGFHVRPATMVMKIVNHYGSEVTMTIDDQEYDAGSALDIFRANEKISAKKRHLIVKEISPFDIKGKITSHNARAIVYGEIKRLVEEGKLRTYEDIAFEDILSEHAEDYLKQEEISTLVAKEIRKLIAGGSIDVRLDVYATFTGDRRALRDISALARANYGEDEKGNNVELPPEIDYLRK